MEVEFATDSLLEGKGFELFVPRHEAAIMHLTEQERLISSPIRCLSAPWGDKLMDRITQAILSEFAQTHQITSLPEDQQFEHLAAFVTVRRHHARTFDTSDIVVGQEGGTGIDAVAIIVNGALVTDIDSVNELADRNGYIEASFVFVEADRGSSFESAKIGLIDARNCRDFRPILERKFPGHCSLGLIIKSVKLIGAQPKEFDLPK